MQYMTLYLDQHRKIIVTLLTNPTYMIGLFYIGKKLLKKLQDIGNQEDEL